MFQLLGGSELCTQVCRILSPRSLKEVSDMLDAVLGSLGAEAGVGFGNSICGEFLGGSVCTLTF